MSSNSSSKHIKYGFGKKVSYSFDDAIKKVTEELQKEGFGVLTTIDVAGTLKKKLNKDMHPYQILGACNPNIAHRALDAEPSVGLLMPCNVVVRQDGDGNVYVEFMDPNIISTMMNNPKVAEAAAEGREKLQKIFNSL